MSGIFGLSGAYDRNLSGLIPEKTRPTFREYGYFGGGYNRKTFLYRMDFSNDTILPSSRGGLASSQDRGSAVGNSNYGYFFKGRGFPTDNSTTISRLDYSNETSVVINELAAAGGYQASQSVGNSNYGYSIGGRDTSANFRSTIQRIDYSTDTSPMSIRGPLTSTVRTAGGCNNSDYGWIIFGTTSTGRSFANQRIDLSNDTIKANLRNNANPLVSEIFANSNQNYGWYANGQTPSGGISNVYRLDFSNDNASVSARGNTVNATNRFNSACSGNSNFGYWTGGNTGTPFPQKSNTDRIDYSNDTAIGSVRAPYPLEIGGHRGVSTHNFGGAPNSQYGVFAKYPYGYFIGGSLNGGASGTKVNRLSFDNDTANASERGSLTNGVSGGAAVSSSNYFYSISGYSSSGLALSFVERQDFSNDTSTATVRSRTSLARGELAAEGNSSYGWIGGGAPNFEAFPFYSTIDRIDYSNDSVNARLRSFLTIARLRTSATGTSNFGYFGAGSFSPASPFLTKRVDRLNHSNDTINPAIRGDLFTLATKRAGTGTANFGYFGGGYSTGGAGAQTSAIDRIDYSNDTATAIQRASILVGRGGIGATGDNNKGYFGGGDQYASGFPYYSTIERLDYSNDTQTQLKSILYDNPVFGQPSLGRTKLSATSALEFGGAKDFQATQTFFDIQSVKSISDTTNYSVKKRALGSFGYFFKSAGSALDRIDYSNDLLTASVRGKYTNSKFAFGSTGNSNFGYSSGGSIPGPIALSLTERIDYSNDNAESLLRGPLPISTLTSSATGNSNFGYIAGNFNNKAFKLDYSNDSIDLREINSISISRPGFSAIGNSNFGYFGGGYIPGTGYATIVDRLDYSNDNAKVLIRGPLSVARSAQSAGNSNFGYFGCDIDISTVDRIDYSNDTIRASVRGPLRFGRQNTGATGNSNFGYFSGGYRFGNHSTIQRIDYSNDLAQTSIRGPLTFSDRVISDGLTNARNS